MNLSGQWNFELDPNDRGIDEEWFERKLTDTIQLPGSLQAQGYGEEISMETPWTGGIVDRTWFDEARYAPYRQPGQVKVPFWLQPPRYYKGAAWYQCEVVIPEDWGGSRLELNLERPHWESRLWIDGREIGFDISLFDTPYL